MSRMHGNWDVSPSISNSSGSPEHLDHRIDKKFVLTFSFQEEEWEATGRKKEKDFRNQWDGKWGQNLKQNT